MSQEPRTRVPSGILSEAFDLFFRSCGYGHNVTHDERINFLTSVNALAPSFHSFTQKAFEDIKRGSISGFVRLCSELVIVGKNERSN